MANRVIRKRVRFDVVTDDAKGDTVDHDGAAGAGDGGHVGAAEKAARIRYVGYGDEKRSLMESVAEDAMCKFGSDGAVLISPASHDRECTWLAIPLATLSQRQPRLTKPPQPLGLKTVRVPGFAVSWHVVADARRFGHVHHAPYAPYVSVVEPAAAMVHVLRINADGELVLVASMDARVALTQPVVLSACLIPTAFRDGVVTKLHLVVAFKGNYLFVLRMKFDTATTPHRLCGNVVLEHVFGQDRSEDELGDVARVGCVIIHGEPFIGVLDRANRCVVVYTVGGKLERAYVAAKGDMQRPVDFAQVNDDSVLAVMDAGTVQIYANAELAAGADMAEHSPCFEVMTPAHENVVAIRSVATPGGAAAILCGLASGAIFVKCPQSRVCSVYSETVTDVVVPF
jgi:hypothetical protein